MIFIFLQIMASMAFGKNGAGSEFSGRGAAASLRSEKVIENDDFRGFDSFQAGRIIGFRSGGWRKIFRYAFSDMLQMRRLFLWMKMQWQFQFSTA